MTNEIDPSSLDLDGVRLGVFDVDHTLVDGATGMYFAYYMAREGHIAWSRLAVGGWWILAHRMGFIDVDATFQGAASDFMGMSREFITRCTQEVFERYVCQRYFEQTRALIDQFHARNIPTLLLSASGDAMVGLIAEDLGVPEFIANHLEWDGDTATGRLLTPYAYGEGKLHYLSEHLARREIPAEAVAGFADSRSDLPLLEHVGFPYAVNPDRALRKTALAQGWPILEHTPQRAVAV